MGVRGLSTYIHEHIPEVLVRHKLHNRKVIIDGNNLAHVLYYECTGINAAFGGDYDKYSSFVEEFFKGLEACHVYPVVLMDGGQPLDNKKMNTVRDRVTNQIQTCLHISPSSQYRLKVFPCMGRDVFVSTLKTMNILVLQTDFEADLDIAMLAKELKMTVLSNDSDFFMFDVPFIPLSSITFNKVTTGKKKKSGEDFNYHACHLFNRDKFCQITGMNPAHFPVLATLLGNDYLPFDYFKEFYNHLETNSRKSRMTARHKTIKNVLDWLSQNKSKTTEKITSSVVSLCSNKYLRRKMKDSMRNYTDTASNLCSIVSKDALEHDVDSTGKKNSENKIRTVEDTILTRKTAVETSLFCRNGKELPEWFVVAYRTHRIHHEVADIVTQGYFISPPQVEDKLSASAYLLVEPIVRVIYTLLWQDFHATKDCAQEAYHQYGSKVMLSEGSSNYLSESCVLPESLAATETYYDPDIVIEEDYEESLDEESHERNKCAQYWIDDAVVKKKKIEISQSNSEASDVNMEANDEVKTDEEIEALEDLVENVEVNNEGHQSRGECLKWYLRKGSRMWIRKVSLLSEENAKALPSLKDIEFLSVPEKRKLFCTVLNSNRQSSLLGLPDDLELILDFIILWYQESKSPLLEVHALSVLVCVFMFYIIDGKVGRVRTRKAFEDEEKWKVRFSNIQSDALYCSAAASVEDILAQVCQEECLLAAHKLFKFHHMDQKISDKYYNKKTVHAFSEYQACIYFVQLLNTLLGSPFPTLNIEHLWGGTFCYNVFYDLKKRSKPLNKISEILGKGSCLERLFYVLFKQLSEVLNFKKYFSTVACVEEKIAEVTNTATHNIKKKKKTRRGKRCNQKDNGSNTERRHLKKEETQEEVKEELVNLSEDSIEERGNVDLLDNRFAELLLNTN